MRITQERLDSNLRVSQLEVALSRAIVGFIEDNQDLTEAEVLEAFSNQLHHRLQRQRQSETLPYEGCHPDHEEGDDE